MKLLKIFKILFVYSILDSEKTYAKVIDSILNKFGKKYTDDMRMKVLGTPEQMTAKLLVEEMKLPINSDEFLTIFHKKCHEALQHPPLIDGLTCCNFLTMF